MSDTLRLRLALIDTFCAGVLSKSNVTEVEKYNCEQIQLLCNTNVPIDDFWKRKEKKL